MSSLLILIKLVSLVYQIKRINDKTLLNEIVTLYKNIVSDSNTLFGNDKTLEKKIKNIIDWMFEQPSDEPIIKSMLIERLVDACKEDKDVLNSITLSLEEIPSEERTRQLVFKNIQEINRGINDNKFEKDFKKIMKEIYYADSTKISRDEWNKVLTVIEDRQKDLIGVDESSEVTESVNTSNIDNLIEIISRAKSEISEEGIMKTGLKGLNKALYPDCGFRRGKYYIFYALTNRGKSFTMSHMLLSIPMYNKPLLRDKTKIPCIVLDSGEDNLDEILIRLYKIIMSNTKGDYEDVKTLDPKVIGETIVETFNKNGWYIHFNRINPSEDTVTKAKDRIRRLEMKGYEVITWLYDYVDMMSVNGVYGDTHTNKLVSLHRELRGFGISKGICFITCGQLSSTAKARYQEQYGDEEEINWARLVAGKSMTQGSTMITNEVDCEITIHIAKLQSGKAYWTFCLGKMRGEGAPDGDRFGFYELDPKLGLIHDINGPNKCRTSLKETLREDGTVTDDVETLNLGL